METGGQEKDEKQMDQSSYLSCPKIDHPRSPNNCELQDKSSQPRAAKSEPDQMNLTELRGE